MAKQTKVAGAVLAGGLARRMDFFDKGLLEYQGKALVSYALAALAPVVDALFINANRHIEQYQQWGFPVISDTSSSFDGPLAGIYSVMLQTDADILLTLPCDAPLIKSEHMAMLLNACQDKTMEVAVAYDGMRIHPVILAVKTSVISSLQQYLAEGGRKMDTWLRQRHMVEVDFSKTPEIFANINTLSDLSMLEDKNA
ncbi:MAG: molybdenum cofactor guanylyltransferase MobA [Methylococcaceae bacterium]|jgi:molybdopterin-guanine dinucleotide biosynthesis protein A